MRDILFNMDSFVFSYRIAGILIRNNKILLQNLKMMTVIQSPGAC